MSAGKMVLVRVGQGVYGWELARVETGGGGGGGGWGVGGVCGVGCG